MKTKNETMESDGLKRYDTLTIFVNSYGEILLMPGSEQVGEDIRYEEDGEEVRATAERQVELPVEMTKDMMDEWIQDQLEDEDSYIHSITEQVKNSGR